MPGAAPSVHELTRAGLPSHVTGYVKKGAWNKADILLATTAEGEVAIKDYGSKILPVRWIGAMQLSREERAYGRLGDVPGIPRFHRRLDRHAIIIQYVGGMRLPKYHRRRGGVPRVAERLSALLDRVHERGVIHGDLRSRDNFLVTDDGEIWLIDFSSAEVFEEGTWASRVVFPRLRRAERRALLKWKVLLVPGELSPEELASHRRFKRVRRLWPFNRKKDLPRTKGRNPLL